MIGRWQDWYQNARVPTHYGNTITYEMGADWLADCETVEDWGCGLGWFSTFRPDAIGVDGTASKFADKVADLSEYTSAVDGIFMRHVLEHNFRWEMVLENALASFSHRMALIVFTPLADTTHQIDFVAEIGVPDISFRLEDLTFPIEQAGCSVIHEEMESETAYNVEHVFLVEKA